MICTKCSCEIPDGAKFCPNCGASFMTARDVMPSAASVPAPENETKYYCEKCGLELARGMKFCGVCGGAAKAKDVSPIANGGDTFGAGNMSAVSLDKPMESDGLVSAMNAAAPASTVPAATGVPTPMFGAPAAPVSSGVPTPTESGFSSGYTASAPTFAPSSNAADMGGFSNANMNNFGSMGNMSPYGGAAAAVKPIKRKSKGKTIALIAGIVVAVLLAAAAIMFFTNRAFVLSTLMGKSKYAAMVEGNNIKSMTDKIDMNSVANGIQSSSGLIMAISSMDALDAPGSLDLMDMTDSIYGSSASSRMSSAGSISGGSMPAIDLSAMEKLYAELLQKTYGKNSVNGSMEMQIKLGSALKSYINENTYSADGMDEINKVLDYINNTKLTYNIAASDSALGYTIGTDGKLKIDAKVLMNGQDMYISLPFASDKAIKITLDKPAENSSVTKTFEVDAKELERILGDIVNIYLEKYASLEIEMDNGKVSAAGITVEGKLISAAFTEKDLLDLTKSVCEYIGKDEYITSKIVELAESCGADYTKEEFYKDIMDGIEDDMFAGDALTLNTAIDRNGNILGKSAEITADGRKFTVSYAEMKDKAGCDLDMGGVKVYLLDEKTDDHNGSVSLGVNAMGVNASIVMDYTNVNTVKFGNTEVMTGKYEISAKMPAAFEDQLGREAFAAASGAKIVMEVAVNGDTMNESMSVTVPGYLDASFKDTLTAVDDSSALAVPSNVIDVTPLAKGEYLDDAAAEQFAQFAKDIANKMNEMGIADIDPDDINDIDASALTGKQSKDNIDYLTKMIGSLKDDIDYEKEYADESTKAALDELDKKCGDLQNRYSAQSSSMTIDEWDAFYQEYRALDDKLDDLTVNYSGEGSVDFSSDYVQTFINALGDLEDYIDECISSGNYAGKEDALRSSKTDIHDLKTRMEAAGINMSEEKAAEFGEEYTNIYLDLVLILQGQ